METAKCFPVPFPGSDQHVGRNREADLLSCFRVDEQLKRGFFHGSTLDDSPSLQNGLAFLEKLLRERRDLAKRIVRARTRGHRYLWENERGTAEVLAKYLNVEMPVALESYRLARPAFTTNSIATDKEVEDFLRADAEILKLKEPAPAAKILDFSLQREVNQELGIR